MLQRNKQLILLSSVIVINLAIAFTLLSRQDVFAPKREISICFSPNNGCQLSIINYLNQASTSIYVHAYSFTNKELANALIEAHHRGLDIKILYDKQQAKSKHSLLPLLQKTGIACYIDQTKGLAHNKIMIIDNNTIITGSYNWSNNAEYRNAENLLFINNKNIAGKYLANWYARLANAKSIDLQPHD